MEGEMDREEYERKVLEELRDLLLEPDGRTRVHSVGYLGNRVDVEEVRLGVSSEGAPEVNLLYRDMRRPECLLGWRMLVVDVSEEEPAELEASVLWANFMEHIEASPKKGLPKDCSPEGINWTI